MLQVKTLPAVERERNSTDIDKAGDAELVGGLGGGSGGNAVERLVIGETKGGCWTSND